MNKDTEYGLLVLLADIREACGDPDGKLMQDELVRHIAEMFDRVGRAESILDRLASGFWVCVLDKNSSGEEPMGGRVLDYWAKYNAEAVGRSPDERMVETISDSRKRENHESPNFGERT